MKDHLAFGDTDVLGSEDPDPGATAGGFKSEHEAGHHQCNVAEL